MPCKQGTDCALGSRPTPSQPSGHLKQPHSDTGAPKSSRRGGRSLRPGHAASNPSLCTHRLRASSAFPAKWLPAECSRHAGRRRGARQLGLCPLPPEGPRAGGAPRAQAPWPAQPTGQWHPQAALEALLGRPTTDPHQDAGPSSRFSFWEETHISRMDSASVVKKEQSAKGYNGSPKAGGAILPEEQKGSRESQL
ncbi:hypothetical protein P7K49_037708 [Saguinus oedipus]|uniref:Uncharacterized protein n=1 Tax=Saguinus oedipus TaxID=9490 RepID=A0ABQ9TJB0_SAGOE|nr:hypothetical protein P7K49_037708 [Saguinus oedipus]